MPSVILAYSLITTFIVGCRDVYNNIQLPANHAIKFKCNLNSSHLCENTIICKIINYSAKVWPMSRYYLSHMYSSVNPILGLTNYWTPICTDLLLALFLSTLFGSYRLSCKLSALWKTRKPLACYMYAKFPYFAFTCSSREAYKSIML